jgi:hypothetical protein
MGVDSGVTSRLSEWELTEYAWHYFLAHGQARLTTFRFYLAFCTIMWTGIAGILATGDKYWLAGMLCLLQAFLSFIYWKVDLRHKELINNAQKALVTCESHWGLADVENNPHPLRLFTVDANDKRERRLSGRFGRLRLTYSKCVSIVFLVMGLGGLMGGMLLIAVSVF